MIIITIKILFFKNIKKPIKNGSFEFGTQIKLFKMTNNAKLHRIDYKRPVIKKASHSRKVFNWETFGSGLTTVRLR